MVRRSIRAAVLSASLAMGLSMPVSSSAWAQTPDENFYFNGQPYSPLDYYLDGPPDTPGCPRQCARDFSPCDPPMYKKVDARCKNSNR